MGGGNVLVFREAEFDILASLMCDMPGHRKAMVRPMSIVDKAPVPLSGLWEESMDSISVGILSFLVRLGELRRLASNHFLTGCHTFTQKQFGPHLISSSAGNPKHPDTPLSKTSHHFLGSHCL